VDDEGLILTVGKDVYIHPNLISSGPLLLSIGYWVIKWRIYC